MKPRLCIAETRQDSIGLSICGKRVGDVLYTDNGRVLDSTVKVFASIDHAFQQMQIPGGDAVCADCCEKVTNTFWGLPD